MRCIKLSKRAPRKTGETAIVPILRDRPHKYSRETTDKNLSVKKDWLINGGSAAGKSHLLARLHEAAPGIWRGKPAIMLAARSPLMAWLDAAPGLPAWYDATPAAVERPWKKLQPHARQQALVAYCKAVRPVLLLDDAHTLSGRKRELVGQLIPAAGIVVSTTIAVSRLPATIRLAILHRQPEHIDLASESTMDATHALTWLFALLALAMGAWPLAAALSGMRMLANGRRSTRQSD